ncbi:MAG: endolytic transglycosylase MltG [Acidobacteriaceae bacterium]
MKYLTFLLLLALVVAGLAAWAIYVPIGPAVGTSDEAATYVDISPGTGTEAIATQLEQAGVLRSRFAFDLLRAIKGGKLIAGEYRFNRPATAPEVYERMVLGDVYTIQVTVPEGYNLFDIAQAVEAAGLGSREAMLAAERSQTELIADLSPNTSSLEGYLFPGTYRFSRHATPDQMVGAMVRHFRQVAAQLGLTPDGSGNEISRTVILASLVEKEVNRDAERPLVAGVFNNRLAQGIPLATDPSVIYAALLEGRYRGAIYASDLESSSPYNTYRRAGLPPGPICNPGMASLKAALEPASTDYLYFVADAEGHSRFSATLKEHAQQVEEYRRALHQPAAVQSRPTHSRSRTKAHASAR